MLLFTLRWSNFHSKIALHSFFFKIEKGRIEFWVTKFSRNRSEFDFGRIEFRSVFLEILGKNEEKRKFSGIIHLRNLIFEKINS